MSDGAAAVPGDGDGPATPPPARGDDGTAAPPLVRGVLARVMVEDLDAALPLYVALADGEQPHRFAFGAVRLAQVGSFLLIQGGDDAVRHRTATVLVTDADAVARAVTAAGGVLLDGPAAGPNGPRLIARHPDGAVLEYIEQR